MSQRLDLFWRVLLLENFLWFMGGSQEKCSVVGANLPSIHSQEENVYVQNLHGGEHSWLGLTDINSEGTFVWSDGTSFNYHYWASHQPNNFKNEDCVYTLGFRRGHEYKWNDVSCSDCHKFTCKKGAPLTTSQGTSILHFQYGGVCLHFMRASFNTVFGKSNFKIPLTFSEMTLHFSYTV